MNEEIRKQGKLFGRAVRIKEVKDPKVKEKTEGIKLSSISYSSIRDYLKCPKLFYYRHLMKIKLQQKQMELVFGSAVHSAFEAFTKSQDPRAAFDLEFREKKLLPEELAGDAVQKHKEEGERFIKTFLESQEYLKEVHGLILKGTAERMFRTWMTDPITKQVLPVQFSGRVDFETDDGKIIDYKTSAKPYKQSEVDQDLQPSYYILEYLMRTGKLPEGFYYIVFVKGRKEPLQVIKTTRSKEQLSLAFKMAELVLNGVKGKQFPKGTTWMERFCDCSKYEEALLL